MAMQRQPAKMLRIYLGESDQWEHKPLYQALVELFRREGLGGATAVHGIMGFGAHSRIHSASILTLSQDLPVLIEAVDQADRIDAILPKVDAMVHDGLVITFDVDVRVYRSEPRD